MTAPVQVSSLAPEQIGCTSVKRSGGSVTIECFYPACPSPLIVRRRVINVLDLLRHVDKHFKSHHAAGAA